MRAWAPPVAPQGFTCLGSIPCILKPCETSSIPFSRSLFFFFPSRMPVLIFWDWFSILEELCTQLFVPTGKQGREEA